mgnify:FL=1
MPSNQTPNYQLSQWERTDQVRMEDFNADNAKIDGAIKAQADALSTETAARLALAAQVAKCGNCKIYFAPYSSNTYDDGFIPLPGKPELLFLFNENCHIFIASPHAKRAIYYSSGGNGSKIVTPTWSNSGMTLGSGTHTYPNSGMFVIALFAMD